MRSTIFIVAFLCLFSRLSTAQEERPLKTWTTRHLLDCLSYRQKCDQGLGEFEEELRYRRPIYTLIHEFNRAAPNGDGGLYRDSIKETLYFVSQDRDDPRINSLMRRELDDGTWRGDYYNALYLAKRGDLKALSMLRTNCWKYGISSAEWADALIQFGRQHYRPSIPCLIESANAASLNAADAAYESLLLFYPDAPKDLPSPEATQDYFRNRYRSEHRKRTR